MFYLPNPRAKITLKNTKLDFDSSKAALITAEDNDSNNWGQAGSNGADVSVKAVKQKLTGNIIVDTISSVKLNLTKKSTWTGTAQIEDNTSGATTSDSPVSVSIDGTSSWIVTGDCTVSNLTVKDGGTVKDSDGQTVTVKANGKTVVKGTSSITVTVTGSYTAN